MKKLKLKKTTLRNLSSLDLTKVAGGGSHASCIVVTCTCPPTYACGTNLTDQHCV